MSIQGGPFSIHDSSLVLHLDAGNLKSYLSGSTSWKDLSGNGYNGVLVNAPVVSSGLTLNGTTQYAYISHGGALAFNSGQFTISVWHRNNDSSTTYNGIITNDSNGDNAWKIFRDNGNAFYVARSNGYTANFPAYTVNRFHYYAYTFNSGNLTLYFDGNFVSNTASVTNPVSQNNIAFGSYRYNDALANIYFINQTIGPVMLHNRALSAVEILQNYNTQKSRFGL